MIRSALLMFAVVSAPLAAAAQTPTPSRVDYAGFVSLTAKLQAGRAAHLVSLDRFWALAADGETLILDARSRDAFARGHIAGAVNLPLTDFTAQSLARTIGDPSRRLLIDCNNNFVNDTDPVVTKQVRLALNIQTFINLRGYGYGNIYELAEAVDFNSPRVRWVKGESAPPADGSGAAIKPG
jgi:phage shock protein E